MTIIYKKHTKIEYKSQTIVCDKCGRKANANEHPQTEWHRFECFNFGYEYYELFDIDMHYELDLCGHCTTEILKDLLKDKRKKVLEEASKRKSCECKNPILLGSGDVPSIPDGYGRCQICRLFIKT